MRKTILAMGALAGGLLAAGGQAQQLKNPVQDAPSQAAPVPPAGPMPPAAPMPPAGPVPQTGADRAAAARTTTTVAGIAYRSCMVEVVGQPPSACGGTGILYSILPQGRVMISVPMRDGSLLAFVASADRQVRPDDYVMYLSHLRLTRAGQNQTREVSGTCQAAMSPDGKIWLSVTCEATDAQRRPTRLRMAGNGTPVEVVRSGG